MTSLGAKGEKGKTKNTLECNQLVIQQILLAELTLEEPKLMLLAFINKEKITSKKAKEADDLPCHSSNPMNPDHIPVKQNRK